jgi:transcriptional regulator with XRE-family HTH domain
MGKFDELENLLDGAKLCYRTPLIRAIGKANISVEELSYIVRVPEGMLYKVLRDNEDPWPELMADLSVILNVPITELFPELDSNELR